MRNKTEEQIVDEIGAVTQSLIDFLPRAVMIIAKNDCQKCQVIYAAVAIKLAAQIIEELMEENVDRKHYDTYRSLLNHIIISTETTKGTLQ